MVFRLFLFSFMTWGSIYSSLALGKSFVLSNIVPTDDVYEDFLENVNEKEYKKALEEIDEIIEEYTEDKKRNELNHAKVVKFKLLRMIGEVDKAFDILLSMKIDQDIVYGVYRINNLMKYHRENSFEKVSKNTFAGNLVSTWETKKFRSYLNKELLKMSKYLTEDLKPNKLNVNLFDKGNFPFSIRESLIEKLSYTLSELLLDQRFWSLGQVRKLETLIDQNVLKANYKSIENFSFELNMNDHPLISTLKILKNLEGILWRKDLLSALIEARIFKDNLIFSISKDVKIKYLVVEKLKFFLRDLNIDPWWSVGMYHVAKMSLLLNSNNSNDYIIKSLNECSDNFPKSYGARKCISLLKTLKNKKIKITANSYMNFENEPLKFVSRNIETIYFKIFPFDEFKLRSSFKDVTRKIQLSDINSILDKASSEVKKLQVLNWSEFYDKESLLKLPSSPVGTYLIAFSSEKDFKPENNVFGFQIIQNTNYIPSFIDLGTKLKMLVHTIEGGKLVEVQDILFKSFDGHNLLNIKGSFIQKKSLSTKGIITLKVENKEIDIRVTGKLFTNKENFDHYKIIHERIINLGQESFGYQIFSDSKNSNFKIGKIVEISLTNESGELINSKKTSLNKNGFVKGTYNLPKGLKQGSYKLKINTKTVSSLKIIPKKNDDLNFTISKHSENEIKISVKDKKDEVIANSSIRVQIVKVIESSKIKNEKKLILDSEKLTDAMGNILVDLSQKMNINSYVYFQVVVSAKLAGKPVSLLKNFHPFKENIYLELHDTSKGFDSKIDLVCRAQRLNSNKVVSRPGKLLVYGLEKNSSKKLSERKTTDLVKFFDIKSDLKKIQINGLAPGSYRGIYKLNNKKLKVGDAFVEFTIKTDGGHNNLDFEAEINKSDVVVGSKFKIWGANKDNTQEIHIKIINRDKILFSKSTKNASIVTLKTKKSWVGENLVKISSLVNGEVKEKTFSLNIRSKELKKPSVVPSVGYIKAGEEISFKLKTPKSYIGQKVKILFYLSSIDSKCFDKTQKSDDLWEKSILDFQISNELISEYSQVIVKESLIDYINPTMRIFSYNKTSTKSKFEEIPHSFRTLSQHEGIQLIEKEIKVGKKETEIKFLMPKTKGLWKSQLAISSEDGKNPLLITNILETF